MFYFFSLMIFRKVVLCINPETEYFNKWKELIFNFQQNMNDECAEDLTKIFNDSTNDLSKKRDNQEEFLTTWRITNSSNLHSLQFYEFISLDLKCKIKSKNETFLWLLTLPNFYCLYENNGFLFAYCLPHSCNHHHAETIGKSAFKKFAKPSTMDDDRKGVLKCSMLAGDFSNYFFGFAVMLTITVIATVLSLSGTVLHFLRYFFHFHLFVILILITQFVWQQ